ncbi:MAG: Carboxyl-terminal protease [Candidatus Saccharibacteria bacterium]|nr:Carboxyl-terminal protease [Candidatus Saccharibacteria bacterium]
MEESNYNMQEHQPQRHAWSLRKIGLTILASALLFGAGLAVGRGNIQINSLSHSRTAASSSSALDYSSVDAVYSLLKSDFDGSLNNKALIDGLKSGLVSAAGDPYTQYFNPTEAKAFNDQLAGTITGIGAELGTDADNNIVVVSPLSGYPAEKAGLKPKDIVAGVDGKSTSGMSVDQVVRKIRGQAGTDVALTIVRGGATPFNVTITRQKITVPSVKWQEDGNIGYLKISQFSDDTVSLAQKAVTEFKDKKVKGIVLDLRSDPGGYLNSAVDISSLWLDQGKTVVQEKRGGKVTATELASGNNPLRGMPTVVLIDGGSASASEITAGALRDNNVATLVGEKSFGKGSVQQVEHLLDGSQLKVTIARWFRPNGKNIDKQGITPDTVVTNSDADVKAGKDAQKDMAYQLLQQKL